MLGSINQVGNETHHCFLGIPRLSKYTLSKGNQCTLDREGRSTKNMFYLITSPALTTSFAADRASYASRTSYEAEERDFCELK